MGAGIVGLCIALRLRQAGHAVTLVDRGPPAGECSSGNAGAISSRSIVPLAMPGLLKTVPGMLLDPTGPLYLPATYLLQAMPWLVRFVAAARPERVARIAKALDTLLHDAVPLHQRLAEEVGCPQRLHVSGQMHLYPTQAAREKDRQSWAIKEAYGLQFETLDGAAIRALEPAVGERYQTGVFLPHEAWLSEPHQYALAVATAARAIGVTFVQQGVESMARAGAGWSVRTTGGTFDAAHVVLAAGAWSARLLKPLGIHVPLETQRGYHLDVQSPGFTLQRQVVLVDRKVFITPMEHGLRIAGTVEFGGLERGANDERANLLIEHASQGLPTLDRTSPRTPWMGHRPCLPDSMPVIGPVPSLPGLWCAFGHGHLGLTGSAPTAEWIVEGISGRLDAARLAPFAVTRFG